MSCAGLLRPADGVHPPHDPVYSDAIAASPESKTHPFRSDQRSTRRIDHGPDPRSPRRHQPRLRSDQAPADSKPTPPHAGGPGPSRGFAPWQVGPPPNAAMPAAIQVPGSDSSSDNTQRQSQRHDHPGLGCARDRHRPRSFTPPRRRLRPRRHPFVMQASAATHRPPGPPHCLIPTVDVSVCLACGWCAFGLADAVSFVGSGCRGWARPPPGRACLLAFLCWRRCSLCVVPALACLAR